MASVSAPSRARSADRLSSSRFISLASGHAFANAASIGAMECLRAWIRVMRGGVVIEPVYPVSCPGRSAMRSIALQSRGPLGPLGPGSVQQLHAAARPGHACLLERHCVHQAALAPEAIEATVELERA